MRPAHFLAEGKQASIVACRRRSLSIGWAPYIPWNKRTVDTWSAGHRSRGQQKAQEENAAGASGVPGPQARAHPRWLTTLWFPSTRRKLPVALRTMSPRRTTMICWVVRAFRLRKCLSCMAILVFSLKFAKVAATAIIAILESSVTRHCGTVLATSQNHETGRASACDQVLRNGSVCGLDSR
jgi:hypothetical protein